MNARAFATLFDRPAIIAEAGYGNIRTLPLHRNDGLEVVYLEHGHLNWEVEGRPVEFKRESVFYTFPEELHGSRQANEPGHFWYFVVMRGEGSAPDRSKKTPLSFPKLGIAPEHCAKMVRILKNSKKRCWQSSPLLTATIKKLVNEAREQNEWREEMIVTLGRLILIELSRIVSQGDAAAQAPIRFTRKIQRALHEIQSHPEKKWTLASMAKVSGLHRTHFTSAVRHETGDTPLLFLRRIRVERARNMLQMTDATVTEIAFACGFESSQHFARIFRKFSNQSASDYRKSSRRS